MIKQLISKQQFPLLAKVLINCNMDSPVRKGMIFFTTDRAVRITVVKKKLLTHDCHNPKSIRGFRQN